MFSEYGVPVIFLQSQQQADWAAVFGTWAAVLVSTAALLFSVYLFVDSKRPDLIAYVRENYDTKEMFLVLRNMGRGVAYDVELSTEKGPYWVSEPGYEGKVASSFFGKGVRMLAPGEERVTFLATESFFGKVTESGPVGIEVTWALRSGGKRRGPRSFRADADSLRCVVPDSDRQRMIRQLNLIGREINSIRLGMFGELGATGAEARKVSALEGIADAVAVPEDREME